MYAWLIATVAATAGLLFGFDIAVINGALVFLKQQWGLTGFETEIAASSLLFGCVFGAAAGGALSDRFGRRRVLMLCALLFGISAIGAALPRDLAEFTAARFLGGVAIGVASLIAPLYIAEVAPAHLRGRLVSLNQMAIVTGILLAYFINWTLSFQGAESWRWMFAVAAAPSAAFFIALFFVPESPRWLVARGLPAEALRVLERTLGGGAPAALQQIERTIREESGSLAELFRPGLRRALGIALFLAIMQQWSGVNTVLFYGALILKEQVGGQSDSAAIGASVLIGLINFAATIAAIALIDRLGRKALLIGSALGMAVCLLGLAAALRQPEPSASLVIVCMLGCVASFGVGLGPGVWVVLSEIFPNRIRGRAMGIATVALWCACVALTMTYLSLSSALGPSGAFSLYAVMCLATALFVWLLTPETKERTLEEIESFFQENRP